MTSEDENRDLIAKILQESDDDDEDEIDKIIMQNLRQKGLATEGKLNANEF